MKKMIFAALVVASMVMAAHATPGNNGGGNGGCGVGQQTNGCGSTGGAGGNGGAGGTGVGVGIGIAGAAASATSTSAAGAAVIGSGNSSNTNVLGQQQGQMQGISGSGNSSATGGNASAAGGNGAGNTTSVIVKGAERSAPGLGGAVAPVQVRNCRVGIGFGGSNANGAFTAAVPLGNDQTCLVGAMLEAMETAGGFSMKSKQTVACTIEGMDVLDECKALKAKPARAAGDMPKPWQAGG